MVVLQAMLSIALALSPHTQNIYADGWNKKSTLVVTQPVEVPGMILEAGTYTINLQESTSRRSVVQIVGADGKVITRLLAIPDFRSRENMFEDAFSFHSIKGDGPKVLQSWYYPGDLNGLEFVYSRERASQIATQTDTHVAASNGKDTKTCSIVAVTPSGVEVVIDEAPLTEVARQKPKS